jgi:hypothetical protein
VLLNGAIEAKRNNCTINSYICSFDKAIEAKLLEFPRNQAPVSFSSTEEHFLLSYNGILLIINRQSGDVVEEIETDTFVLSSRNDVFSTLIYLHSEFAVYGVSYERKKLDASASCVDSLC